MKTLEEARAYRREWYQKNKQRQIEARRKWVAANPEKVLLYKARHFPKRMAKQKADIPALRAQIFEKLGNKCAHPDCTWTDPRAFQIDHINGGGSKERKAFGVGPYWLRKVLKDPEMNQKYQILCCNHNWIKRLESDEIPNRRKTSPVWQLLEK